MKKVIFILLSICFIAFNAESQQRRALNLTRYDITPIHFGMSLALNTMDFTIHNSGKFLTSIDSIYAIENKKTVGFNINIVTNYNFTRFFSIRFLPGLNFGERDLEYWVRNGGVLSKHIMKIESTFLDFPVLLQYKSVRVNNFRPYVIAGGCYKYDLAAQKKIRQEDMPKIKLQKKGYYYEIGFGTDFFNEFFKFAMELKYTVGINNIIVPDNTQYTAAIEKMTSRMVTLSFLFEGSDLRYFFGRDTRKLVSKRNRRAF